jgi:predicted dehydrogenase
MKSYASIDELLADEVDLVIVNTPVETYEYAKSFIV